MITHELATYIMLKCDDILIFLQIVLLIVGLLSSILFAIMISAIVSNDWEMVNKMKSMLSIYIFITILISASYALIPSSKQAQQIFSQEVKS